MKKALWFAIFLSCLVLDERLHAVSNQRVWALEGNYAGVGLARHWGPRWSTQLRSQVAQDVLVAGFRQSFHFRPAGAIAPYLGLEADYTQFEGDYSEGSGVAVEPYLGAEYFLNNRWSLLLDFGPAWIFLEDTNTALTQEGLEFVINLGFALHFGREVRR